jgi:LysM repeat protein
MLGLEYQAAGLATTRSLIKSRPDVFRSLMKAYVEAIHYYKTHPRESMGILQKYLKIDDPDALRETYEGVGLTLVPERPYPTLKGIQMILGEMAAVEPRAQTAKPDQFVDLTFLKELDESGFIDQLYKSRPALASTGVRSGAATSKDAPAAKSAAVAQDKRKQAAVPQPKASAAGAQEYTIQSGDTLARIAQKYYGDVLKWTRIFEANKQTLKTPNFIFVGQKIIIPLDDIASGPAAGSSQ